MSKDKQNKKLINALITIAESSSKQSEIPTSVRKIETVKEVLYKVLIENPYKFKQYELFNEVHINRRKKSKTLKLESYQLEKSELCSLLGWGIHGDEQGKIALVPAESEDYKKLLNNPSIKKIKAYNKK